MNRINLIRRQLNTCELKAKVTNTKDKKLKQHDSAIDYFNFDEFLTKEEREYRKKLRSFLEQEIRPNLYEYNKNAESPTPLIQKLNKAFPGIACLSLKGYSCPGFSHFLTMAIIMEIARVDASIATFIMVHGDELAMRCIYALGSEEQKNYYLPKMKNLELIGCFCLTEPEYGSDATSLKTSVEEDENGDFIINGKKRWIGNATIADVFIVWARNTKTKKVEGFIVEKGTPGLKASKIEQKLSLRMVQNADVTFTNVKVKKANRLPQATNFQDGVNQVLLHSRLGVATLAVGMMIGAYDNAIKYCSQRKQFGQEIINYQLIQEKLARLMGNANAGIYMVKRIYEHEMQGKMTIGHVGLAKGWCTLRLRESVALAREVMGGNGILFENGAMQAMIDAESIYTYEGTYDINMLAVGKEITGVAAFK